MKQISALALLLCMCTTGVLVAQTKPIVVIDPGHGGQELGVEANGLIEKDLVLRLGFVLADEFVQHGYDVRFTRTGDTAVAWPDRRSTAESVGAVALIMLHMNGDDDPNQHGTEIYVNENDSAVVALADAVAESIRELDTPVEVVPRPWPFLQSSTVRTIMIENGHLTNPVERRLLTSSDYHRQWSKKVVAGTVAALTAEN